MGDEPFYEFGKDESWSFQGHTLAEHKPRVRRAFRWTVLFFVVAESILAAWPIVATVIWTLEASLTWIWFVYIPRVLFLLYALIMTSEVITLFGAGHRAKGNFMRTLGAFAPSNTLALWTVFAWVGGAILGVIFVFFTAVTWSFFDSTLLPAVAIAIGVLSIVESIAAPFLVYRFGVFIPILKAHNVEKSKKETRLPRAATSSFNPPTSGKQIATGRKGSQGGTGERKQSKSALSKRTPESRLRAHKGVLKNKNRLNRTSRTSNRGSLFPN